VDLAKIDSFERKWAVGMGAKEDEGTFFRPQERAQLTGKIYRHTERARGLTFWLIAEGMREDSRREIRLEPAGKFRRKRLWLKWRGIMQKHTQSRKRIWVKIIKIRNRQGAETAASAVPTLLLSGLHLQIGRPISSRPAHPIALTRTSSRLENDLARVETTTTTTLSSLCQILRTDCKPRASPRSMSQVILFTLRVVFITHLFYILVVRREN